LEKAHICLFSILPLGAKALYHNGIFAYSERGEIIHDCDLSIRSDLPALLKRQHAARRASAVGEAVHRRSGQGNGVSGQ
jgi:hypothetical protein